MMMKIIHFLKKMFTGGIAIRVSKYDENKNAKTVSFPKIAPWMMVLIPLLGYLGNTGNPLVWLAVVATVIVVFFGFFYYSVFKSELPKTNEELANDILSIGFNNDEIKFADDSKDEEKEEIPEAVLEAIEESKEVETETETENKECGEDCDCHCTEDQELLDLAKVDDIIAEEYLKDLEEEQELEVPTMKSTKGEIISYLEAKGIEYKKGETKAKLLEKI